MKRLLFASPLLFALTLSAVPADAGVGFGADVVNRYVWRGTDFGNAVSVQPGMSISHGNIEIGAWSSWAISGGGANENDLYASFSSGPIGVTLTDYYFPGQDFNDDEEQTMHSFSYSNDDGVHMARSQRVPRPRRRALERRGCLLTISATPIIRSGQKRPTTWARWKRPPSASPSASATGFTLQRPIRPWSASDSTWARATTSPRISSTQTKKAPSSSSAGASKTWSAFQRGTQTRSRGRVRRGTRPLIPYQPLL